MREEERRLMAERLKGLGYIRSEQVFNAMLNVPRELFLPEDLKSHAYEDRPLPIGMNQTISAPHMVALMCELLELERDSKVLEVGAGSGYHACVIAEIVVEGQVFSVEKIEKLSERARGNLEAVGCGRVTVMTADGTRGYEERAPYDRILVTAGAPDVPPPLIEQLKIGGRMVIPVGSRYLQDLILIEKLGESEIERRNLGGCAFVPLIGEHGWGD